MDETEIKIERIESKGLVFNTDDFLKSLKVFGWTMASAFVALLISAMSDLQIPAEYAFFVPIVNTVLYSLKQFFTDNRVPVDQR